MKTLLTILKRSLYLFVLTILISPVMLLAQPAGYTRLKIDWFNASNETGPVLPVNAPFDAEGNVYVSENKGVWSEDDPTVVLRKYQISKYSPDGQFISAFGLGENEAISDHTLQVALDNSGKFYLHTVHEEINPNGFCVSVRDQNGKFLKAIVHQGTGYDSLIGEDFSNFVFDKDWNIVIADWGDQSIKKFSRDGKYLGRIQKPGIASNKSFKIGSLAYDRVVGRFYATDVFNDRILVYDNNFNLLRTLAGSENVYQNICKILVHPLTHELWIESCGGFQIDILDSLGNNQGFFKDENGYSFWNPGAMDMSQTGVLSLYYLNEENLQLYFPITTNIIKAKGPVQNIVAYEMEEGKITIVESQVNEIKEVVLSNIMGQKETHSSNNIQTQLKGLVLIYVMYHDGSSGMAKLVMK